MTPAGLITGMLFFSGKGDSQTVVVAKEAHVVSTQVAAVVTKEAHVANTQVTAVVAKEAHVANTQVTVACKCP